MAAGELEAKSQVQASARQQEELTCRSLLVNAVPDVKRLGAGQLSGQCIQVLRTCMQQWVSAGNQRSVQYTTLENWFLDAAV